MQFIDYLIYSCLALTVIFGLGLILDHLAALHVNRQTRRHESNHDIPGAQL